MHQHVEEASDERVAQIRMRLSSEKAIAETEMLKQGLRLLCSQVYAARTLLVAPTLGRELSRIAYEMARLTKLLDNSGVNPQSLVSMDLADFIFAHTHYDECSNWYFFRRS